jgi:hypothetical protein
MVYERPDEDPSKAFCKKVADKLSNKSYNGHGSQSRAKVVLWVMYNEEDGYYIENRGAMLEQEGGDHYNNTSDALVKVYNKLESSMTPETARKQILRLY